MPRSVVPNFEKTLSNDEEDEEPGSRNLRYIARTIPTNTPFFKYSGPTTRGPPGEAPSVSEKDAFSSFLATQVTRSVTELPSAAAKTPEEFDGGSHEDQDHEYQDASEFRTPGGPDHNTATRDSHGPDHYGCLEAEPIKDSQDRLWTEIDALDDVKRLANDVNLYEEFPPDFEQELTKIRASHAHLLKAMRDRKARVEEERRHQITTKTDSRANIAGETTTATAGTAGNTSGRINQDYMGATVKADEDKYVQEMIENIKSMTK
ncbi:hypothetical protein HG536_0D01000 [Torulaspora globosa]|uniref:Uncharacterized protein n=1 Tax=Torulaspora globosa TaxID=48254 RepID=A0A7G3ZGE2_9SACH|nr:uncharacterized protein HG536_0D01000 [Torulaspora globosa]QLL32578.1 hypothetical protein HG536_0D01000 [Torulaspora globosa]